MAFPFLADDYQGALDDDVPNKDNKDILPEKALPLPYLADPAASYLDYRCWVECVLDAGMVLHKSLPQKQASVDTLASDFIDNKLLDQNKKSGVNIKPAAQTVDTIQRMATSTYRFVLKGYGIRIGYQIPIPGLKSVGGMTAVPQGEQRAYNALAGYALGGIPIWFARWEISYVLVGTPTGTTAPIPPNLGAHIYPNTPLPQTVALPQTPIDMSAVASPGPDLPIPVEQL
jgi:hypothetical protein